MSGGKIRKESMCGKNRYEKERERKKERGGRKQANGTSRKGKLRKRKEVWDVTMKYSERKHEGMKKIAKEFIKGWDMVKKIEK